MTTFTGNFGSTSNSASGTISLFLNVDAALGALSPGTIWGRTTGSGTVSNYSFKSAGKSGFPHSGSAGSATLADSSNGIPDINDNWTITGTLGGSTDTVRLDGNLTANPSVSPGLNKDGTAITGTVTVDTTAITGSPDFTGSITLTGPALPTLYNLAEMSAFIEGLGPLPTGWTQIASRAAGPVTVVALANSDSSQIVIVMPATVAPSIGHAQQAAYTIGADLTSLGSPSSPPDANFRQMVAAASQLLADEHRANFGAQITLTGHSLGGAIAQLVGLASGYSTVAFDAPGSTFLYTQLQTELAPALSDDTVNHNPEANVDIRVTGDAVSLINSSYTINPLTLQSPVHGVNGNGQALTDTVKDIGGNHEISVILQELSQSTTTVGSSAEPNSDVTNWANSVVTIASETSTATKLTKAFSFFADAASHHYAIDPSFGSLFVFTETASSPAISSVTFLDDPSIATYKVWSLVGTTWSAPQVVTAGSAATFGDGIHEFKFEALSSSGQIVSLPSGFLFDATFASSGQVNATLLDQTAAAAHDFNLDLNSDLLYRNDNGAVSTWDMNDHTFIGNNFGAVPTSWHIAGKGDFNGDGITDILWRNDNGAVSTWDMHDNTFTGGDFGVVPTTWQIVGTGDFNGDGRTDILWRDTSGNVATWDMNDHTYVGFNFGAVPTNYSVAGTGDFNGDGKTDILWRDISGNVSTWDMNDHSFVGFNFGAVPTSWKVAGTGDFNGDGITDVVWHNDNGAVSTWDMNDHTFTGFDFTASTGLVPTSWHIADTGDFNADGKTDIVWRNTNGAVSTWDMNDHTFTGFDFTASTGAVPTSWHIS